MKEFDFIKNIRSRVRKYHSNLKVGIGDDCAVIDLGDKYQLVTADMLTEGDHFRLDWATPLQIGMKAMEVSVSDIAVMGGVPTFAFVSICFEKGISSEIKKGVMDGVLKVCDKYKITLAGGDTTAGKNMVINVTMMGEVEKDKLKLRSGAKVGDKIFVTGKLGGSWAGLEFLRNQGGTLRRAFTEGEKYIFEKHLEPVARLDVSRVLAKYANAMIDVSDGLGSEVRHIAKESNLGAVVYEEKVPIDEKVLEMARELKKDPMKWAMSGGEDFEIVGTIAESDLINLDFPIKIVGEIKEEKEGIKFVRKSGEVEEMPGGWEHE